MKGWTDLKDAFFAAVDAQPDERARQIAALRSVDPALADRLRALLSADDRGASLRHIFQVDDVSADRPSRIGAYEVTGVLGVGGMGEVYRAHDPKLHRDVAIKVLPPSLASDRERLARFEREAQVLASLNHRHIAHVYGLDESAGRPAIVMELVPGPTLATLIAEQPGRSLALSKALTIARQIADGLDAAHEKGIIHRDLKPGNVALTEDGDVKILDFGVAKTLDAGLKLPSAFAATDVGVVIGTAAYMSPEQARGLTLDKRADIWAFGCLLYELLSGRQAFGGNTGSDSLAAVLEREPDMTILPARTPAGVRLLIRHCLEKDPKHRVRDIADARLAIDDALAQDGRDFRDARLDRGSSGRWVFWLLGSIGVAAAVAIVVIALQAAAPEADPRRRTVASLVLPQGMRLAGSDLEAQSSESRFAVSPDGRKLAMIAAADSSRVQLWLRDLGSTALQLLPGTENASFPFWSPDSGAIGFVAAGKLKAIRLSDGTVMTLSESGFRMAAWSRNNLILFTPARASPLHVVPASGGTPTPVTKLDQTNGDFQHGYPAFLPDGRHFLYFGIGTRAGGALDPRGTYVGSLDGAEPAKLLVAGATQARYANGHLLFVQRGTLMAQAFDVESRELRGAPQPLVEDVRLATVGATGAMAAFSVSDNGVLVCQAALKTASRLLWFDRAGKQVGALAGPADYGDLALSHDGARLAVSVTDPAQSTRDLWLYDVASGRGQRLTVDVGDEFAPVWSPDGSRLLFSSSSKGLVDLYTKNAGSSGDSQMLEVDSQGLGRFAADWSRDGRYILYVGGGRAIAMSDLWVAPLSSPRNARALLESPFVETHGRFVPSGPWFAYTSNETGRLEVYVDRFPDLGAKRLVSTNGGGWPRWGSDGSELFYLSPENQLMAVTVTVTPDRLDVEVPHQLFAFKRAPARLDAYAYDVSPNRQRFLVSAMVEDTTPTAMTLVLNWTDGLTKK